MLYANDQTGEQIIQFSLTDITVAQISDQNLFRKLEKVFNTNEEQPII